MLLRKKTHCDSGKVWFFIFMLYIFCRCFPAYSQICIYLYYFRATFAKHGKAAWEYSRVHTEHHSIDECGNRNLELLIFFVPLSIS